MIDKQFLADWENGLLNPITVSGYWIGNPSPESRPSSTIKADSFRGFLEILDVARPDFQYTIDRYQFENFTGGSFVVVLSPEAVQIAETLERVTRQAELYDDDLAAWFK